MAVNRVAFGIPCMRARYTCRHWASLHWWSWAGLEWDDYIWLEYGQFGGRP